MHGFILVAKCWQANSNWSKTLEINPGIKSGSSNFCMLTQGFQRYPYVNIYIYIYIYIWSNYSICFCLLYLLHLIWKYFKLFLVIYRYGGQFMFYSLDKSICFRAPTEWLVCNIFVISTFYVYIIYN